MTRMSKPQELSSSGNVSEQNDDGKEDSRESVIKEDEGRQKRRIRLKRQNQWDWETRRKRSQDSREISSCQKESLFFCRHWEYHQNYLHKKEETSCLEFRSTFNSFFSEASRLLSLFSVDSSFTVTVNRKLRVRLTWESSWFCLHHRGMIFDSIFFVTLLTVTSIVL